MTLSRAAMVRCMPPCSLAVPHQRALSTLRADTDCHTLVAASSRACSCLSLCFCCGVAVCVCPTVCACARMRVGANACLCVPIMHMCVYIYLYPIRASGKQRTRHWGRRQEANHGRRHQVEILKSQLCRVCDTDFSRVSLRRLLCRVLVTDHGLHYEPRRYAPDPD